MSFPATRPTCLATLSLHDALPILPPLRRTVVRFLVGVPFPVAQFRRWLHGGSACATPGELFRSPLPRCCSPLPRRAPRRSEEHTSELQSLRHLVCRLLLEKNNTQE